MRDEKKVRLNDSMTVGPQPDEQDLQDLKQQGFRSVVNFRTAGEEEQPLSPDTERVAVEQQGMQYLHHPVSMKEMSSETVTQFRNRLSELPLPVYLHCKSGMRAGAMAMMHLAVEQGMSGEQTLEQAQAMGFQCDKPELKEFVKQYVDQQAQAAG